VQSRQREVHSGYGAGGAPLAASLSCGVVWVAARQRGRHMLVGISHHLMNEPACVLCLLAVLALACAAAAAEHPTDTAAPGKPAGGTGAGAERASGEPYKLAGRRIVFTNWLYVRPGAHAWVDDAGNGVSASRAAKMGDWDAHFRTFDMPRGIRIVAQPALRRSDAIHPEKPWEGRFSVTTLLQDGVKLRFWGTCPQPCYLESADGVTWTRPNLGLVEFQGSKENNLYPGLPGESLFLDPSAPPEERYKAVGIDGISPAEFEAYKKERPKDWEPRAWRRDVGQIYAFRGAVSPDGFHWTRLPRIFSVEHADTQNTCYYDQQLRKYVLFTRTWWVSDQDPGNRGDLSPDAAWIAPGRRSIGRAESDTFGSFPVSEKVLVPPPDVLPSEVLYTNCKTTVPGQPDNHLLFPAVWNMGSDSTRIVMASSSDGRLWSWLPNGTVLETGSFGEFDGGAIFASPNLVESANGDFALPYNGYRFPHKYPRGGEGFPPNLGFAVWPKGRIVALEAEGVGEFTTVGFTPPGNRLRINAVTRRAGHILVEACQLNPGCTDLKPIPGHSFDDCKPIIGDQFRTPVTWKGGQDVGVPVGRPLALRFRMGQARIFALEFE